MGAKTEEEKKEAQVQKCLKKHETPLPAPMRVLNEYRMLTELSYECKTFREFRPSCKGELKWTGLVCPEKEPYNEKAWRIEFEIPRNYPQRPPTIKFLTPIHHPNVSAETGEVKLELIEKSEWKESVEMTDVLKALIELIEHPNAENSKLVLNEVAAKQYKVNNNDFKKKAQEQANKTGLQRPPDPKPRGKKAASNE